MRALFAFFVAFGLISCVFAAEISGPQPTLAQVPLIIETAKGPARFTVEMATTPSQQERGLMFRKDLAPNAGMLFDFVNEGPQAFWMKNTLIPLDMVWIDEAHRIVHIAHDVPPCKADPCPDYPPHAKASSVLELAAGAAARHHLKEGDLLLFEGLDRAVVK